MFLVETKNRSKKKKHEIKKKVDELKTNYHLSNIKIISGKLDFYI